MIKSLNPGGFLKYPASDAELERRWSAVRSEMKNVGVDVLVIQGEESDLAGYIKWFSDLIPDYPATILFPQEGGMISIRSGAPSRPFPPPFAARGMAKRLAAPYFRTLHYTGDMDGKIAAENILELGAKRVGLVNTGRMHACFYNTLMEQLDGKVEFVDFTDPVDEIKAVKSEEELEYVRASVWMHDKIFEAMPTIIRPGRLESEIRHDVHDLACKMGAEGFSLVLVKSAPMGTPAGQAAVPYLNRRVEDGDQVSVMLESSGPGGYYCEMGRVFCLSEPCEELRRAWSDGCAAQDLVADLLRPGNTTPEILDVLNVFLAERGYELEERLFSHGQGFDLIERPGVMPGETMKLRENMVLSVHPTCLNRHAQAFCCDDYIVTKDGGVRLQTYPRELIVL